MSAELSCSRRLAMFTDRFEESSDAGVAVTILVKYQSHTLAIRTYNTSIDPATGFRKFDLSLAIDNSAQPARTTAPDVYREIISRPKNIVRTGGQIHRQFIRVPSPVGATDHKSITAESH